MNRLFSLILAAPLALAAQQPGGDGARPIGLDEAVRLARLNAPAVVQARNAIRSAAAAVRTRYGAFMPTLSFGGGAQTQQGQRYSVDLDSIIRQDAPWRANHSFSSNYDIFSGGRRWFDLQTARANVDAAEASEVSQSFAIARDVKQQYFAVLAAREQQGAARIQLEQAQQQLRAAVGRMAAGAATRSDSLRSIIQVGNARLAALTAENALATANASLSRLIGSAQIVTAEPGDTAEVPALSLTESQLYDIVEQGPAVQQARAQLFAAQQSKRSALAPYLPTLSLGLSQAFTASADGFGFLGDGRNKNLSTSLRVSFPLFNGLSREQQVVATRVAEDNAQAQLRDARLNARQQLVQQLGVFRTALARVEIQASSVAAGEEDLRVQQERYNLGAGTLLELITSQTTLITARQALIQARLDARNAKAQLEALVGRDLK